MSDTKSRSEKALVSFSKAVKYESLIAGISGGVVSTLVLHPLDLLKIRFAVDDGRSAKERPKYYGLRHAFATVFSQEGFKGLYKGGKNCQDLSCLGKVTDVTNGVQKLRNVIDLLWVRGLQQHQNLHPPFTHDLQGAL